MHELRRIIAEKVKTDIMPGFIEFLASLRTRKDIKRASRVLGALSVEGSITDPKYWIGALKNALTTEKELCVSDIPTNKQGFLTFLGKLNDHFSEK